MTISFRRQQKGVGLIAMSDGVTIESDNQLDSLVSELNSNSSVRCLDDPHDNRLGDDDDEDELDDLDDDEDEFEDEDEDEEEGY